MFISVPGGITAAEGFQASGVPAGIKYKNKKDVALVYSMFEAAVAGVFTTNIVKAAPILLNINRLSVSGTAKAVIVNSGNANACTGDRGMKDALAMTEETARLLGIPKEQVFVASTGVIGQPMPMDRIIKGVAMAVNDLSDIGGQDAAEAIMTTDTTLKQYALTFELGGRKITIGGMAKGSGMIHPNMATMLGFITTDASISSECLDKCLHQANEKSFNMITVDGDTSTNDMVMVLANGQAGNNKIIDFDSEDCRIFCDGLTEICVYLAKEVAKDGEGATKFIQVRVVNALNERDAGLAARSIAGSSLFKAAVFGEDANWGRIMCAAGYSGANFNPEKFNVFLGGVQVAKDGGALDFDEGTAAEVLAGKEIDVLVDFVEGTCEATAWGCDLTHEYIKINGNYRS
jgi:glutamate N-acetyltransferase/amino-acid N-acetyltransferase